LAEQRRLERESRNDIFKIFIPLAPALLEAFLPKKDNVLLDIMKENINKQEAQNLRMMDKLERAAAGPVVPPTSPLELITQLNNARKEGREEMKELLEMVEEKATERAEEMAASGDNKEESMLSLAMKNLGPIVGALVAQGKQPVIPAPEAQEAIASNETPQPIEAAPVQQPPTPEQVDQRKIAEIVFPFLAEQILRMEQSHKVDPKSAAKESLQLLKLKGFPQARVLKLFSRDVLFAILRTYKVSNTFDSWFNDYYAALTVQEPTAALRSKLTPLRAGTRAAPAASVTPQPSAPDKTDGLGHDPGKPGSVAPDKPNGHAKEGIVLDISGKNLSGAPTGGPAESNQPLSS
jgi:hypothetical protein